MRLDALLLVAAPALLALTGACATAQASATDVASTRAYLDANYKLLQAAATHATAAEARLREMLIQVRGECPNVAFESPQNQDSKELSNEVIGVMVLNVYHLDLPAVRRFMRASARLSWTDARLTHAVRRYVGKLGSLARISIPSVCADVRSWVMSSFQTLAPATTLFDAEFFPVWVGVGELPAALGPFERPDEGATIRRIDAIKSELADREARAVVWWGKITAAIGLN